jgi:hypothetical protein
MLISICFKTIMCADLQNNCVVNSEGVVGLYTGVRFPTEAEDFSSSLCVQTGFGAYPASCPMGTGGKARPRRDTNHSPPSSAEVKNEEELYLLSPMRLHGV